MSENTKPTKTKAKAKEVKPKEVKAKEVKPKEVKAKEVKKRKKKSSVNKERYYVNGKEFHLAISEYYKTGDTETIPDQLAIYIKKIAEGLSYAPNFINYSYKEDMVGDAIVKMLSALRNRKYNPETGSNPFSYFTTIAFHAFINRIKKEKKHREMISDYQEAMYSELMSSEMGSKIADSTASHNASDDDS
jgi:hypothetical protein